MKGLILQELYSMKRLIKFYLVVLVLYAVLGYMQGGFSNLGTIWIMLSSIVYTNAFSYHEKSKWDLYAATLPVSRRQMVRTVYAVSFVFLGGAVLMGLLFNLADVLIFQKELTEMLVVTGSSCLVAIMYLSVFIPILFYFGPERGRLLLVGVYLVPVLAIYLVVRIWGIDDATVLFLLKNSATIGTAVVLAFLFLSYRISVLLYARKEF